MVNTKAKTKKLTPKERKDLAIGKMLAARAAAARSVGNKKAAPKRAMKSAPKPPVVRKQKPAVVKYTKRSRNYKGWRVVNTNNTAGALVPQQILQLPPCVVREPFDMTKNLLDQLPLEIFERVIEYVAQDPVSFVVLSLTCRAFHEIWETLTPDTERAISLRTCTADMYGNRFSLQGLLAGWISQKEDMFYDWAADKYFTAEETEMIDIGFDDEVSAARSRGQEIKERRRDRRERAREKRRKRANERYYSADYPDWYDDDDEESEDTDVDMDNEDEPIIMSSDDSESESEESDSDSDHAGTWLSRNNR